MGKILTNQNSIQEEIESRLKPGNACYHSMQNLLFSSLLRKNIKIKMYRSIILPVVCVGGKFCRPPHQIKIRAIKSRRMSEAGHVHVQGETRGAYRVLVGKTEKRPLGRGRRRWEDNIKMELRKWEGDMDWIDLAQERDRWWARVDAVMNLLIPLNAGNFLTS